MQAYEQRDYSRISSKFDPHPQYLPRPRDTSGGNISPKLEPSATSPTLPRIPSFALGSLPPNSRVLLPPPGEDLHISAADAVPRSTPSVSSSMAAISNGSNNSNGGGGPTTGITPTFTGYVGNTRDALLLFEASLRGILHHVSRRPHDRERGDLMRSGSIFIFDENTSGIKRWTDGIAWSPSRILGDFLVYRQLEKPFPPGEKKRAAKRQGRKKRLSSMSEPYPSASALLGAGDPQQQQGSTLQQGPVSPTQQQSQPHHHRRLSASTVAGANQIINVRSDDDGSSGGLDAERALVGSLVDSYGFKEGGLIKKTMSVIVKGSPHHLVSYYRPEDVTSGALQRPSSVPWLKDLQISPALTERQNLRNPPGAGRADSLDTGLPTINSHRPDPTSPIGSSRPTDYDAYRQPFNKNTNSGYEKSAAPVALYPPSSYSMISGSGGPTGRQPSYPGFQDQKVYDYHLQQQQQQAPGLINKSHQQPQQQQQQQQQRQPQHQQPYGSSEGRPVSESNESYSNSYQSPYHHQTPSQHGHGPGGYSLNNYVQGNNVQRPQQQQQQQQQQQRYRGDHSGQVGTPQPSQQYNSGGNNQGNTTHPLAMSPPGPVGIGGLDPYSPLSRTSPYMRSQPSSQPWSSGQQQPRNMPGISFGSAEPSGISQYGGYDPNGPSSGSGGANNAAQANLRMGNDNWWHDQNGENGGERSLAAGDFRQMRR